MILETRLTELAQAAGTGDKALRVLINGNAADLSQLATTDQTSLVAALNELHAAIATASGINDGAPSGASVWSSSKTRTEIDAARSGAVADAIDDGAPAAGTAWSSVKTRGEIDDAVAGVIDDEATGTGATWSANAILAAVANAKSEIIGGADAAYDTLVEIQALLQDDSALDAINTGLANRVRFDESQALTPTQQTTARTNIGAAEAAALGDTDRDLVAVFDAAVSS